MAQATVFSGRYELHRRLGRGGMAEVFLARDLQLDRPVAVKVLFPEFATDPAFVARFRREAQAAANLNHPNIVGVYDWGQEHGTYFIVMEYVDGRSLADLIRDAGTLAPERAADIATDIAAALAHAHKGGMLHRDIKPGNILVTESGLVKVADWGIGRAMDTAAEENLTQAGSVMGTATYFSPEQAQGLALDPRSDLYALGVVLYEMLTGRPPFSGDSPVAIAYKHVQEQPRPPRSVNMAIPPELEAIVLMLLEKDPARRYASADDVRADLRRYREGFKVMATQAQAAAPLTTAAVVPVAVEGTQAMPVVVHQTRAVVGVPVEDLPREYVPQREKRSWAFLVALIVLLGILAGLLFLLAQTLGVGEDETPETPQVAVPSLATFTEGDATAALLAPNCTQTDPATSATVRVSCFVVGTTEFTEVDDPTLVGTVISQDPEGGEFVDQGTTVTLTVGAQNQIVIPEVQGSSIDEAASILSGSGFTSPPGRADESSVDVPKDEVIRTEPPAGDQAPADAVITLIVSSGPPPVPVPECAGLEVAECRGRLDQAGFTHHEVGETSDEPEGNVLRTEPAQGEEAEEGQDIAIIVSSGPATDTVPPVVGLDRDAAVELLEENFEVDVQVQTVAAGDPNDGKVISQNPGGNAEAEPGSTITIVVGQAEEAPPEETTADVGD